MEVDKLDICSRYCSRCLCSCDLRHYQIHHTARWTDVLFKTFAETLSTLTGLSLNDTNLFDVTFEHRGRMLFESMWDYVLNCATKKQAYIHTTLHFVKLFSIYL